MADQKQTCSLLLISHDMEWVNAFQKGVQRFFITNVQSIETIDAFEELLTKDVLPDLVVLGVDQTLPTMDKLKQSMHRINRNAPVLVISPVGEATDNYIKQGADFTVARRDLLSAIRAVQHVMREHEFQDHTRQANAAFHAIQERYTRLFLDLPDPLCYLQDGLFIDANPAFLRTFKIKDKPTLDEMTIMSFVALKSERNIKQLMKLALEKDVVPAEKIDMQDSEGGRHEMLAQVSEVEINGERVVQLYLRDANASGSGVGGGLDPTTGLGNLTLLRSSIRQTQERSEEKLLGTWIYFWVENYREVFQKDGFRVAEILMRSVADTAQRLLPPSTEMVRYADDAILMWITGDKEQTITRVQNLVSHLDELVPENIGRLIHPRSFAGMLEVRHDSSFDELLSKSYRAVRALAVGQSKERIAEPASADMSRKDERRVLQINQIIDGGRIQFLYQPISALEPDGKSRYADKINILPDPNAVEGLEEDLEIEVMFQLADRYGLGRKIDRIKVAQFCQDILSYEGDQQGITGFLGVSIDSLNDESFPEWLEAQLKQTGISPSQVVFELKIDTANTGYSGAQRLMNKMRPLGAKFAISEIGRFDDEVKEIFERVKPEVVKLDMREIDTFEDDEEVRFMTAIKDYANEHKVMLIADHMESPAQLSRVWPYDIQFLQGDGMVPAMKHFDFNFNEPLF